MTELSLRRFFVSYSRKDSDVVRPVVELLRSTGSRVFRDEDSIPPGKLWRDVLAQSLREADVVVVFWSASSAVSAEVKREFREAAKRGKDIIPVLLDETPLCETLSTYQFIDFQPFTTWASSFRSMLGGLARAIAERLRTGEFVARADSASLVHGVLVFYNAAGSCAVGALVNEIELAGLRAVTWNAELFDTDWIDSETYNTISHSAALLCLVGSDDLGSRWLSKVTTTLAFADQPAGLLTMDCRFFDLPRDLNLANIRVRKFEESQKVIDWLIRIVGPSRLLNRSGCGPRR